MVWLANSSTIKSSTSWSALEMVLLSLAWKTIFSIAFTFVGEPLRLLYQLRVAGTAGSGGAVHGDNDRKRTFHGLDTPVDMTFYGDTSGLLINV